MRPTRFLLSVLLLACSIDGAAATAAERDRPATYANPVLDDDFPDPAVLKANGYYYAYATQTDSNGARLNIQVARSTNLVNWERLGDALPQRPAWARSTWKFWAPHVLEDKGRYYIYYSAAQDRSPNDHCLAVAVADNPAGPFHDKGEPLHCGSGFANIDPMAFDDPATGKRLLYWGSGFGPIRVQELASDRLSFARGSSPIDLIQADGSEDYRRLVEGAWMTRHGGWYYLFYSGDNCCGPQAHYAVMVARARSATGPFQTLAAATGARNSAILEQRDVWVAPGHNSIVEDGRGRQWIVYHAVDSRRPKSSPGAEINSRRVMLIDRLAWRNGWPRVVGNGPSTGPQPSPALPRR